jgi:hypothetical protein
MTIVEIFDLIDQKAREHDQEFVVLTVHAPRRRRGRRIVLLPPPKRVMGHVVGEQEARTIVSCKIADFQRWFRAHLDLIERQAIQLAENGLDEQSKSVMEQYLALRDRLAGAETSWGARV